MYTLQLMKIRSDRQQHIINPKHIKENILSSAAQINISKASHSYIYITCYRAKKIKALCRNSENKNLLFFEKQIKIYKNIYLEKDVSSCIYTTKYTPSLIKKKLFQHSSVQHRRRCIKFAYFFHTQILPHTPICASRTYV